MQPLPVAHTLHPKAVLGIVGPQPHPSSASPDARSCLPPSRCPDNFPLPRPSPPHPRRNFSPCPDSCLFGSSDQPLPRIVRPPVPLPVPRQLLCILFFLTSFTSRSIAPLPWEDGDMHADRDPGTRCRCPCRLRGKLRLTRSAWVRDGEAGEDYARVPRGECHAPWFCDFSGNVIFPTRRRCTGRYAGRDKVLGKCRPCRMPSMPKRTSVERLCPAAPCSLATPCNPAILRQMKLLFACRVNHFGPWTMGREGTADY